MGAKQADLVWDTCEIARRQAEYLKEQDTTLTDDQAFHDACEDSDLIQFEYDDLCDCLTDLMNKLQDGHQWAARVADFGWQGLSGSRIFSAETGRKLLDAILPQTECTFNIFVDDDHLSIQNFHHDSPVGREWYYIYPLPPDSEEEDDT